MKNIYWTNVNHDYIHLTSSSADCKQEIKRTAFDLETKHKKATFLSRYLYCFNILQRTRNVLLNTWDAIVPVPEAARSKA